MTQPVSEASVSPSALKKKTLPGLKRLGTLPTWCLLSDVAGRGESARLINYLDYDAPERNLTSPIFIIGRAGYELTDEQMKLYKRGEKSASSDSSVSLDDPMYPDIQIDSPLVSGVHCYLMINRGAPIVVDTSSNGVFVNDKRIPRDERIKLFHGDHIQLVFTPKNLTSSIPYVKAFNFVPLRHPPGQMLERHLHQRDAPKAAAAPADTQKSQAIDASSVGTRFTHTNTRSSNNQQQQKQNQKPETYEAWNRTLMETHGSRQSDDLKNNKSINHDDIILQRSKNVPKIFTSGGIGIQNQKLVEIGRGGTSVVYAALDGLTGKRVAVKEIRKTAAEYGKGGVSREQYSSLARFETNEYRQEQHTQYSSSSENTSDTNVNNNSQNQNNNNNQNDAAAASSSGNQILYQRQNTANSDELRAEKVDAAVKTTIVENNKNNNDNDDDDDDDSSSFSSNFSETSSEDDDLEVEDDFAIAFGERHPELKRLSDERSRLRKEQEKREQEAAAELERVRQVQKKAMIAGEEANSPPILSQDSTNPPSAKKGRKDLLLSQNDNNDNNNNEDDANATTAVEKEVVKNEKKSSSSSSRRVKNKKDNNNNSATPNNKINLGELEVLTNIKNPRIVELLGFEETPFCYRLYLQYIPGGSLADLIRQFGGMVESVARVYIMEILFGLDFLHREKNLVHGDIKPSNILIDEGGSGYIKITDFGTSYFLSKKSTTATSNNNDNDDDQQQQQPGSEQLGAPIGFTPHYCAPEMCRNMTGATKASDMWALGCMVIEMLTGLLPWQRDNPELFNNAYRNPQDFPWQLMYFISQQKEHPTLDGLYEEVPNPQYDAWARVHGTNYMIMRQQLEDETPPDQWDAVQKVWNEKTGVVPPPPEFVRGDPLVSHALIDFIHQCLEMDPRKRPSANELLNHHFIVGNDLTVDDLRELIRKDRLAKAQKQLEVNPAAQSIDTNNDSQFSVVPLSQDTGVSSASSFNNNNNNNNNNNTNNQDAALLTSSLNNNTNNMMNNSLLARIPNNNNTDCHQRNKTQDNDDDDDDEEIEELFSAPTHPRCHGISTLDPQNSIEKQEANFVKLSTQRTRYLSRKLSGHDSRGGGGDNQRTGQQQQAKPGEQLSESQQVQNKELLSILDGGNAPPSQLDNNSNNAPRTVDDAYAFIRAKRRDQEARIRKELTQEEEEPNSVLGEGGEQEGVRRQRGRDTNDDENGGPSSTAQQQQRQRQQTRQQVANDVSESSSGLTHIFEETMRISGNKREE